jgi:chromosome segregation ATPase
MADDWEDLVIETGVDTLLNYLAKHQKASVSQISDDLGVSKKRIKDWADALESNQFLKKNYSARHGMVLEYTKQSKDVTDEKVDELKKKVAEETQKVQKEMSNRKVDIKNAKTNLEEMQSELEDNREKEMELKQKIDELHELEEELEEDLASYKEEEQRLQSRSANLISRIDATLNRIDEAENRAEEFEETEQKIKKKLKALKKMEKHKNVAEAEEKLRELKDTRNTASEIISSFKSGVKNLFGRKKNSNNILDGTVEEVKNRVEKLDDPDYQHLIELEENGDNRKTVKDYLEAKINE